MSSPSLPSLPSSSSPSLPSSSSPSLPSSSSPSLPSSSSPSFSRTDSIVYDIEHVPVDDDPRKWSPFRKNLTLFLLSSASLIVSLSGNIQNPAVQQMHDELHATSGQFSLSISLFVLLQGLMPFMWTAIGEIKGRKLVYLASLGMAVLGSIATALSPNMPCVIGFRCIQAIGSSAITATGASTLADIFDPEERGTKMGIYYIAPLLAPVIGPLLGGALTTLFNWRAIFWFLAIYVGMNCFSFIFFRDTFRKERSLMYQQALKSRLKHLQATGNIVLAQKSLPASSSTLTNAKFPSELTNVDQEKGIVDEHTNTVKDGKCAVQPDHSQIKLSLKDFNPIKHVGQTLQRVNNVTILLASGLSFAYCYMVTYAAARTLAFGYGYNALKIGLVILSFGLGCVLGSVCGGRWSDHSLRKLKEANGGEVYPEMRLKSTILGIVVLPFVVAVMGWIWQKQVHIAVVCVMFFLNGFFYVWPYSSALAYIIDANNGRSSIVVAGNSAFRGVFAFLATELAVPLQDGLGDGWMMTVWAFIMVLVGVLIGVTYWKGKAWREKAESREAAAN